MIIYSILTGGGNKAGTFNSTLSSTRLKLQEPRTNCSLGEHSGQHTGFSGVSCQCKALWWYISEKDRDKDLAFECKERSFWVTAVSLLKVVD